MREVKIVVGAGSGLGARAPQSAPLPRLRHRSASTQGAPTGRPCRSLLGRRARLLAPQSGVIFGKHDYRAQLSKAAAKVLPPEKAVTFTAYDLRHARATQWAEGGNLVGVAYLLGHKQVTTTNKYARPNQAAAKRVLNVKDCRPATWIGKGGHRVQLSCDLVPIPLAA